MARPSSDMESTIDLPVENFQCLEKLELYFNKSKPAILCRKCGLVLKPGGDRVSKHLSKSRGIAKGNRRGPNALTWSLNLPDPSALPVRPDGSSPHPYLEDRDAPPVSTTDYVS